MCDARGMNGFINGPWFLKCEGLQNGIQRWLIFPTIGKATSGRSSLHQTMLRKESNWFVCPFMSQSEGQAQEMKKWDQNHVLS